MIEMDVAIPKCKICKRFYVIKKVSEVIYENGVRKIQETFKWVCPKCGNTLPAKSKLEDEK